LIRFDSIRFLFTPHFLRFLSLLPSLIVRFLCTLLEVFVFVTLLNCAILMHTSRGFCSYKLGLLNCVILIHHYWSSFAYKLGLLHWASFIGFPSLDFLHWVSLIEHTLLNFVFILHFRGWIRCEVKIFGLASVIRSRHFFKYTFYHLPDIFLKINLIDLYCSYDHSNRMPILSLPIFLPGLS